MFITLLFPTYLRHSDLRCLLSAINCQTRMPDEIIIVVGPADIQSLDVIDGFTDLSGRIRVLAATKPSVVHALNLGFSISKGEIICLTDDDSIPPPDWIKNIEIHFQSNEVVGAVGGRDRLLLPNEPELSNPFPVKRIGLINFFGVMEGNHHCGALRSPAFVDVLKGVNLSFRRAAFPVMRIDAALEFKGAETGWEVDVCMFIKKNGYKLIYDNLVCLDHAVGQRLHEDHRNELNTESALRRVENNSYVMSKHLPFPKSLSGFLYAVLRGSRIYPGLLVFICLKVSGERIKWRYLTLILKFNCRGFIKGLRSRISGF